MKTICLFSPGVLPIPVTKGGAIETLIDILIEQNEIYQNVKFLVISVKDKSIIEKNVEYKYTQIVYVKKNHIADKIYGLTYRVLRRIFKLQLPFASLYYLKAFFKLKRMHTDYIVAEGGNYNTFKAIKKLCPQDHLILHIHHHLLPNQIIDKIFNRVIGVSEFVTNQWKVHSQNSKLVGETVLNCIREEIFIQRLTVQEKLEVRTKMGFSERDFIVLFCGRIIDVKGVKELLEAVRRIECNDIKLLLIGSPEFTTKVETPYLIMIKELVEGMGERVKFTGYIPNEELYRYYQVANVQVIPSLWEEAAGLVAIEGMASGLPLIVTDSGGLTEYVDDTCSIVVKRDDRLIDNLALEINKLYNNPELCMLMGNAGKKRAKKFSKKNFYENFIRAIGLYNE